MTPELYIQIGAVVATILLAVLRFDRNFRSFISRRYTDHELYIHMAATWVVAVGLWPVVAFAYTGGSIWWAGARIWSHLRTWLKP